MSMHSWECARSRAAGVVAVVVVALACCVGVASAQEGAPRRVKVLWLGDSGHHKPLERVRQVFTAMARRGVDLAYTDVVADLNAENLKRYDCLLLYANIEKIAPEQEKALL